MGTIIHLFFHSCIFMFFLGQVVEGKIDKEMLGKLEKSQSQANTLYIENKGQIGDQDGKPNPAVKYLILRPGLNIQLKANSFSYDAYTIERFKRVEQLPEPIHHKFDKQDDDSLVYHFSRVDIELVDANPNPLITHEGVSSDYLNYYTHITSQTNGEEGATGVRGYSTITYHDIYPNIDLEWFLDNNGKPEYQFIINPGGDPSNIRLKYHGAQKTELISDAIHIHIKPGIIKEHIPLSYLKESKEKVQISFIKLSNDEYGFEYPKYASNETLVIDPVPNRLWGTYYGGSGDEIVRSSFLNSDDNIFITGRTNSSLQISTIGSYQSIIGGNVDAFLTKLNSNGERQWSTYYGGSGDDSGLSVLCNFSTNVFISGETNSTIGISTNGSHQKNLGGFTDAFIAKFNNKGIREWATYYGGGTSEYGFLASDGNYLYLAGRTESDDAISTSGAYQTSIAGFREAFLIKFNSNDGVRIWGTYLGGPDHEYLYSVVCDVNGNIIVTGGTGSTSGIATVGAHQTNKSGGLWDTFLMKFNPSGILLWGTYSGVESDDTGWSLSCDSNSNIIVSGFTKPSSGMATNGAFQTTYGGGAWDVFITKFSAQGNRQWSTYFGGNGDESGGYGNGDISGTSIACDETGSIFLAGSSTSITSISTIDAFQKDNSGKNDAFITKFMGDGSRVWSTYYGGSEDDYATSIAYKNQHIIVTGRTSSVTNISSTLSHQNTFSGGLQDGYIVKFNTISPHSITVSIIDSILCKKTPFEITYTLLGVFNSPNSLIVQLSDSAGSFSFPIVIGSAATTSTGKIMCKIPDSVSIGTRFRIRLLSTNPIVTGTDNGRDLTVSGLPPPIISGSDLVCFNSLPSTFTVNYQPGYTVHWLKPRIGSIISYKLNAVSIIWNSMGTDSVRVKFEDQLTGCERDTMLRVIITSPEPLITGDARACENQSPKVYRVQKQSGRTYSWSKPKNGIIVGSTTSDSISVQWVNSGSDTLRMEERDNATNCTKDTSFIVSIAPLPDATIIGSSQVRENEQGITYSVKNESGLRYDWSIVSGDANIAGKTGNSVTLNAGKPGTVILKVKITNQNGCMSESELAITVKSLTSIREISSAPFTLYPNPAGDHLYVKMDAEITGDINIELYDVLGNRHFQQTYQTTEVIRIPVQSLSQGMYMIKVKTSQDEYMERFVK